ncbi:MAG: C25 family cysteine peptidase [Candidatus Sumerlaeia bacterium]|nr:C25 family cysteine peptidase [Candidatus Sumerlaeia bacterium]
MNDRIFLASVIFFLFSLAPGNAREQDYSIPGLLYEKNVGVQILEEEAERLRFELVNSNPLQPITSETRLEFFRWLAVPPEGNFEGELVEAEWYVSWEGGELEGPFELEDESSVGPLPQGFIKVRGNYSDMVRQLPIAPLKLSVATMTNRRSGALEKGVIVLKRGVFEVKLVGKMELLDSPQNLDEVDPFLEELAGELVVNSNLMGQRLVKFENSSFIEEERRWSDFLSRLPEGVVVKALVPPAGGIYELSPDHFEGAGISPSSVLAQDLRVVAQGREIPLHLEGGDSGAFVGSKRGYFHVPPLENIRTEWNAVYILTERLPLDRDDVLSTQPLRLALESANPSLVQRGAKSSVELDIFSPNLYSPRTAFHPLYGRWVMGRVGKNEMGRYPFEVNGFEANEEASLEVTLMGSQLGMKQCFQVFLNGISLGESEVTNGMGPFVRQYKVPQGTLVNGSNELVVQYVQVLEDDFVPEIYVGNAVLRYGVQESSNPLFRELSYVANPEQEVFISADGNIQEGKTFFLDITDSREPRLFQTTRLFENQQNTWSIGYKARAPKGKGVFFNTLGTKPLPKLSRIDLSSALVNARGADLLIITHERFSNTLLRYKEIREKEGFRVEIVETDRIYQALGYGVKNDKVIADFIRYVYGNWKAPRLQMVLFVGEASEYWLQLTHPKKDVSENLLPVYGFADGNEEIRGDVPYGWVSGKGELCDLITGRFSVATEEQLNRVIDQIVAYEKAPVNGDWRNRHLLITDDEPEFERVSERLIGSELTSHAVPVRIYLQDNPYEDYFRLRERKRSFETTRMITEELNKGAFTATYIGHGGPNLWSGERIFHYRDLDLIHNNGLRPIMTAASCDTAWIDYPVEPVRESIGEQFITHPTGGGIALFAPVAGTNSYEHDFLLRPFFESLLDRRFERLGTITLYSRIQYMLYRNQGHVPKQYVLIGDPALMIPAKPNEFVLEAAPGVLLSNQQAEIVVRGQSQEILKGNALIRFLSPMGEDVSEAIQTAVVDGKFEEVIRVPVFKKTGNHRILVSISHEGKNLINTSEGIVRVLEPKVQTDWTITPESENGVLPSGTPVSLKLRVKNPYELPLQGLNLQITDVISNKTLTSTPLELAASADRLFEFSFPLPDGITAIQAEVNYPEPNQLRKPVASARVELQGMGSVVQQPLLIPANLIRVERQGNPESTRFTIPVYNLNSTELALEKVGLYLMDSEQGSLVGTELTSLEIPANGTKEIVFAQNVLFPSVKLAFQLRGNKMMDDGGDLIVYPFVLDIKESVDAAIVPGSVKTERRDYRRSETVIVTALVENKGTEPIKSLRTGLYVRVPWDKNTLASSINQQSITTFSTPLSPGEQREVRLRWDPRLRDPISTRLYVVANDLQELFEVDYANNVGDIAVSMKRLPNLVLDKEKTKFIANQENGSSVLNLNVSFRNDSEYDFAHEFIVEINAFNSSKQEQLVYRTKINDLASGASNVLQANWKYSKEHRYISIHINAEREFGEETYEDNMLEIPLVHEEYLDFAALEDGLKLSDFLSSADFTNSLMLPDYSVGIQKWPQVGDTLVFSNEYVSGTPLPTQRPGSEADQLMLIDSNGTLSWTIQESPAPTGFRIPMDSLDDTTFYDFYLLQHRGNEVLGKFANRYRLKIEGGDWVENTEFNMSRRYIGRISTEDDYLDVVFAPTETPSICDFFNLIVVPVRGEVLLPVMTYDHFPKSSISMEGVIPEGCRVVLEYRLQKSDGSWGSWGGTGDILPEQQAAGKIQFRVVLFGNAESTPSVKQVLIVPLGFQDQVALRKAS